MIKFTDEEQNKQFIAIELKEKINSNAVYSYLKAYFPIIEKGFYKMDEDEIILNFEGIEYNFSLNELKEEAATIAKVDAYVFAVDMKEKSQRYCLMG